MRKLIVIFLLAQSVWSYSQSDLSLKTNTLSLSFIRFDIKDYNFTNPKLFLGLNYEYAIKPKLSLQAGIEGSFQKYTEFGSSYNGANGLYYSVVETKNKVLRFLLGYQYIFGESNQKGIKPYIGNNLFYKNLNQYSETYFEHNNDIITTSKSTQNQLGLQQTLGLKIYLKQKFVLAPEYAANFVFYDSYTSSYSLNLMVMRLKLGVLF
ncbi:MAG: hypothetical protein ACWA41_02375 [Putridiphycobacter sp.]